MTDLEKFYRNHFQDENSMDWDELTDEQKKGLEKCGEYQQFKLNNAIDDFRMAVSNELDKLVRVLKSIK